MSGVEIERGYQCFYWGNEVLSAGVMVDTVRQ